jgi:hypothetical protein
MTWTLLLVLLLRYFQSTLNLDRKFAYLHNLETYISELLGQEAVTKQIYQRESSAYFVEKGKHFRDIAWFFYSFIFPLIVVGILVFTGWQEFWLSSIPNGNKAYDIAIALAGLVSIVVYTFRYGPPSLTFPLLKKKT